VKRAARLVAHFALGLLAGELLAAAARTAHAELLAADLLAELTELVELHTAPVRPRLDLATPAELLAELTARVAPPADVVPGEVS
jgi:hypothetical protein